MTRSPPCSCFIPRFGHCPSTFSWSLMSPSLQTKGRKASGRRWTCSFSSFSPLAPSPCSELLFILCIHLWNNEVKRALVCLLWESQQPKAWVSHWGQYGTELHDGKNHHTDQVQQKHECETWAHTPTASSKVRPFSGESNLAKYQEPEMGSYLLSQ